jgi:hypothetical protein
VILLPIAPTFSVQAAIAPYLNNAPLGDPADFAAGLKGEEA